MLKPNKCKHFSGLMNDTCRAGVVYDTIRDESARPYRYPCIDPDAATTCAACQYPTPDEIAASEAEFEAHMTQMREDAELFAIARPKTGNSTVFVCQLCPRSNRHATLDRAAMVTHLATHDVTEEMIRGATGRMREHVDGRDFFQNNDVFTLPDGREFLLRSARQQRFGNDAMAWGPAKRKRR